MLKNLFSRTSHNWPLLILLFTITLAYFGLVKGSLINNRLQYQTLETSNQNLLGPFETSGSSSRYLLTRALAERGSFNLSPEEASLASPDIAKINGGYLSLFPPGTSLVAVPFYLIGRYFNLSQIFTFASTGLFYLTNAFLIYFIARRLKVTKAAAAFAGLSFALATFSLSYSLTLTQHHLSTLLILLSLFLAGNKPSSLNLGLIGLLYGFGILVDIPNALLLLPVFMFAAAKTINLKTTSKSVKITLQPGLALLILGLLPFLALFGYYNLKTSGSPLVLAQLSGRNHDFYVNEPANLSKENSSTPDPLQLHTRYQLSGISTLVLTPERGLFYYSPVLLLGLAGLYYLLKRSNPEAQVAAAIILINLFFYTLFYDPAGGWSFGPRYLIPTAALLSLFIGPFLDRYYRRLPMIILALILFMTSLFINLTGALTTTQVPPKAETLSMASPIPYHLGYNLSLLSVTNQTGSLIYQKYFTAITPAQYAAFLAALALLPAIIILTGVTKGRLRESL
jgi:hypothetical protein